MSQSQTDKYAPSPDWGNIAGNVQAQTDLVNLINAGGTSAILKAIAALTAATGKMIYFTSATAAATTDSTAIGRSILAATVAGSSASATPDAWLAVTVSGSAGVIPWYVLPT